MLENTAIRTRAKEKGVRLWELAEIMGISEPTITRRLRRELPAEQQEEMLALIDEIAAEKKNAGQRVAAR